MPILKPKPPADVAAAFSRQLPEFVWVAGNDTVKQEYVGAMGPIPSLADLGRPGEPEMLHDPQQLFLLGLTDVARNTGIGAASRAGWRLFAGNRPGRILMGKVSRKKGGWRMTAGYYGERVEAALEASNALDQLAEVREANYELRVLTVPGLSLEAFWLAAVAERGTDLVIPFPAMPNQRIEVLNREASHSMANFLAAIRPVALLRLTAESTYGG